MSYMLDRHCHTCRARGLATLRMTDEELEAQRIAELSKPEVAEAWTKELAGIVHFARARYDELNPEQRKRLHEMEAMLSRRRIATCHNLAREEFHREDHQRARVDRLMREYNFVQEFIGRLPAELQRSLRVEWKRSGGS